MSRSAFASMVLLMLSGVLPAAGQAGLPTGELIADGTWDCADSTGAYAGAIVIAEKTYAYLKPDGRLGGYGKLFQMTVDADMPTFAVQSGYLQTELVTQGMNMRGPKANPWDWSGELYLNVIIPAELKGTLDWECTRRPIPGA